MSNFLEFYEKHKVSPVSQDISDMDRHRQRRLALYRHLGLLPSLWTNHDVLEVGPGGGHNALVVASFNPRRYDLVEPNTTGFKCMQELFAEFFPNHPGIVMHNQRLEATDSSKTYDVVICEGLIPGLSNQEELLTELHKRVRPGGVLVLTCADAISLFFETARRFLSVRLIRNIDAFSDQVRALALAFASHLQTLAGMSRPVDDWVIDNLLNTAPYTADRYFSLGDAITRFVADYYFLGASPQMLENYTWYKQLPSDAADYNRTYLADFQCKWHNLIHYGATSTPRNAALNLKLHQFCLKFAQLTAASRDGVVNLGEVVQALRSIAENVGSIPHVSEAVAELLTMVKKPDLTVDEVSSRYPHFAAAFGRGQQYVSLVRVAP